MTADVLGQAADELLDRSHERDVQLELRHCAYREGYMDGGRGQWSAGYAAATADMKRVQRELVDALGLVGRRLAPGGAAWLASVKRNGGTEYGGAGKPRVTVDPAVIDAARRGGTA